MKSKFQVSYQQVHETFMKSDAALYILSYHSDGN